MINEQKKRVMAKKKKWTLKSDKILTVQSKGEKEAYW